MLVGEFVNIHTVGNGAVAWAKSCASGTLTLHLMAIIAVSGSMTDAAYATASGTDRACAALDSAQGGVSYTPTGDEEFTITLADGDALAYSMAAPLNISAPGGSTQNLAGPGVINVTSANAGNWKVERGSTSTLQCTIAITVIGSTTESDNLAAQQDALSALSMLHHANTMRIGVEANVDARLGGEPSAPTITPNGFAASSSGLAVFSGYENSGADQPEWNVWARGRFSNYDGDGNAFEGGIADFFAGIDYSINRDFVLGAMAGVGRTDFDTLINGTAGEFENDSVTVGAYGGARLFDTIRAGAMVSYTASEYSSSSGTTTGSFAADRITVAFKVSGQYVLTGQASSGFVLEPTADFIFARERQDGFTDSAAVVHPDQIVTAGRLSIGPRFLFPEWYSNGARIRPWVAAIAEYDFSNQSLVSGSELPDVESMTSLRLTAGTDGRVGPGQLSLRGDLSGLGSGEFTAYGGSLAYKIAF